MRAHFRTSLLGARHTAKEKDNEYCLGLLPEKQEAEEDLKKAVTQGQIDRAKEVISEQRDKERDEERNIPSHVGGWGFCLSSAAGIQKTQGHLMAMPCHISPCMARNGMA